MDRLPLNRARGHSTQGRDRRPQLIVVIRSAEEGYVLMADGLTRKLDHPKKKKIKHVKAKPVRMDLDADFPADSCWTAICASF